MTRQRLYPQVDAQETLQAVSIIGDAVAAKILMLLQPGQRRFSQFGLPVSSKTLSTKLKRLEAHGLVTRTFHAEVPPRVEYALTEKGEELLTILNGLVQWEQSWRAK